MKSLSFKLTVMMIAICIAGMGIVTIVGAALNWNSLLSASLEGVSQNTAREAERINGWLENHTAYITAFSIEMSFEDDYSKENMLPRLNSHVDATPVYFDVYMGYPDGIVTFASGHEPDYAGGWASTKRPWYIGAMEDINTPHITAPYTDVQTGELCITASKAVLKSGKVAGVVSSDILIGELKDIIFQTDVGENSYAFLTDADGGILIHPNSAYAPDADDNFQSLSQIENGGYAQLWAETAQDGAKAIAKDPQGTRYYFTAHTIDSTGWRLYTAIPVSVINAPIYRLIAVAVVALILLILAAFAVIYITVKRIIVRPVTDVTQAAKKLAQGDININISGSYNDEMGQLIDSFTDMAKSVQLQTQITQDISGGDLTVSVPVRSQEDTLGHALQQLRGGLNQIIGNLMQAAENVSAGSSQISVNSQTLAHGAALQAASITELSAAITEVNEKLHVSEEKAKSSAEVSREITANAQNGTRQMELMMGAVEEISAASSSISKVIKVIDDIAFQTNILALNAAVEAARAGQHGKGFSVVAEEVRNLAARSAQAAKETTLLISNSVEKATEGSRIAKETADSFQAIIEAIHKTVVLTEEISAATRDQASAIAQINAEVEQVSQVVHSNAATSQQCATAAQQLTSQSEQLSQIVRQFKLSKPPFQQPPSPEAVHYPSI